MAESEMRDPLGLANNNNLPLPYLSSLFLPQDQG